MADQRRRGAEEGPRPAGITLEQVPTFLDTVSPEKTPLLLGPPGVGKSTVVRQYAEDQARRLGLDFIEYTSENAAAILSNPDVFYVFYDVRLSEYTESDFLGFPEKEALTVRDADSGALARRVVATYSPMAWAAVFTDPRVRGLILIDELTNVVKPELQSIAFKLVLDRRIGERELSRHVRIVAAGNLPEHSSVAQALPAPLINRFAVFYILPPTLGRWMEYIRERAGGLNPLVAGYLGKSVAAAQGSGGGALLGTPDEPETIYNFPSPRSWDAFNRDLNRVLRERGEDPGAHDADVLRVLSQEELRVLAQAHLGPAVAAELAAFAALGRYVPDYEEVARDPDAIFQAADRVRRERDSLAATGVVYYTLAYVARVAAERRDVETVRRVAAYLDANAPEFASAFAYMVPDAALRAESMKSRERLTEHLARQWAEAAGKTRRRG